MRTEKINGFWVPTVDIHVEKWKSGDPFSQNKCLNTFISYCESQNKKFKRVLDVGAWAGTWSYAMQKFCKSIIAFEPDGINFECLHKNLAPFNHITCNQNAIGEKNGRVSLTEDNFTQAKRIENKQGNIQMFTIDYYNYSDVELIKIDVEGYEMRVLEGAYKTITYNDENQSNVKFIMVELNNNTKKYGSNNIQVEKYIESLGFRTLISIWPDKVFYRV